MAQVLLYGLEIVPGPEGSDGEAVAQVMQAGLREADSVAALGSLCGPSDGI